MTLIEIMIVLAIIGLLVLLLPRMLRTARKSDLRGDAAKMAAAMRWAYDRAASTASHHRLVVDLDADTFWVERCEGDVKMVRSPDEAKAAEEQAIVAQAAKPPEPPPDIDLSALAGGTATQVNPTVPTLSVASDAGSDATPLPCTPVKGAQGRPTPLTKRAGISVKEIYVSHLEKPADSGRVTINFFALGRGERAVISLTDGDEHVYTVRLHAITGRAEVIDGELRRADDVVTQDETEGTR